MAPSIITEAFAISGLINGLIAISFGLLVFLKDSKNKDNLFYFLMTVSFAVWSLSYWQWLTKDSAEAALFWVKMLTVGSIFIPIFLFHWVLTISKDSDLLKKMLLYFSYLSAIFIILFINSDYVIAGLDQKLFFNFWPTPGPLYTFYVFFIYILLVLYSALILLNQYFHTNDYKIKGRAFYVLLGIAFGFGGGFTNFLLWYNIPIPPYGNLLVVLFPFLLGYSIVKYNLFNIRTVATELLVLFIGSVLLIQIFISNTVLEIILRIVFFLIVSIFSTLLVKSVYREVTQREKIEKLAGELAGTNDKLKTVNNQLSVVNSQLEVSNIKLKELDKQKTEFVSMASHQLRSPLTAIKGYTSMLLEGSYGAFEDRGREVLDRVLQSTNKLNTVIEDFLNITRIELGRMKYEISVFDLGQLVQTVVKDQEPNVTKKGLTIEFQDGAGNHQISADSGKVSQVISNLIDNAIKYTEKGWIKVTVENVTDKKKEKVRFTVADSGVGLNPEAIKKLFQKFVRADDAGQINITGTGLGLYVAQQIVEGLGGKIWAESDGKDQGSRFIVEFPRSDKPVDIAANHQIEAYTRKELKK